MAGLREGHFEEGSFKLSPDEEKESVMPQICRKSGSGGGVRNCKGPEEEMSFMSWRNSQEVMPWDSVIFRGWAGGRNCQRNKRKWPLR